MYRCTKKKLFNKKCPFYPIIIGYRIDIDTINFEKIIYDIVFDSINFFSKRYDLDN